MKSSRKAILFTLLSLLCGISVVWSYLRQYRLLWFPTQLWFLEFPAYSFSELSTMTCILFAGIFAGTVARKHAAKVQSRFQVSFAITGILVNAVILVLPVLNLISIFTPRTITRVVDYKLQIEERGYICVTEIERDDSWRQEVDFDENTVVYEQDQKLAQHKEITRVDTIQPGQVVEIRYIENDRSIYGIKARSITILEGQYRPYKNEHCGHLLP